MKKWDVFAYGDVNADIILPGVSRLPEPGSEVIIPEMPTFVGGGAALFAMGAGKLGLKTVFQGEIGEDCYGTMIRETFQKTGVDDALLRTVPGAKTGISLSFTDEHERAFLTFSGTNASVSIERLDLERVGQSRHVHVTGYDGPVNHDAYLSVLKELKEKTDTTVSFDVGWDVRGVWTRRIYELFPYIDVLFMNETEALHYSGKDSAMAAAMDFAAYVKTAVIKCGRKGSMAMRGSHCCSAGAYTVQAVDTTGAGDSFNAGFVYGFVKGMPTSDCLHVGNACGAMSVTAYGGNTGFPTEEGLRKFLSERQNG